MGIDYCEKHQKMAGITFGCPHFIEAIEGGVPLAVQRRWEELGVPFILCNECAAAVDLARGGVDPSTRTWVGLRQYSSSAAVYCCAREWAEAHDAALLTWFEGREAEFNRRYGDRD